MLIDTDGERMLPCSACPVYVNVDVLKTLIVLDYGRPSISGSILIH